MNELPLPICAVLFDWDGTLADTVPLVTRATNETLEAYGYAPVPDAGIHDGMRFPTAQRMLYHIGREGDDRRTHALARELADDFYERADRLGHLYVELFPGVRELLTALEAQRMPMGLVTNNRGSVVRALLRHSELERLFPVVIAEEDVARPKPDPEGLQSALAALGADTACTLYVGDSLTDAGAALAAGVAAVGAGWPAASVVHKSDNPFPFVYHTPQALLSAIRGGR